MSFVGHNEEEKNQSKGEFLNKMKNFSKESALILQKR